VGDLRDAVLSHRRDPAVVRGDRGRGAPQEGWCHYFPPCL